MKRSVARTLPKTSGKENKEKTLRKRMFNRRRTPKKAWSGYRSSKNGLMTRKTVSSRYDLAKPAEYPKTVDGRKVH